MKKNKQNKPKKLKRSYKVGPVSAAVVLTLLAVGAATIVRHAVKITTGV